MYRLFGQADQGIDRPDILSGQPEVSVAMSRSTEKSHSSSMMLIIPAAPSGGHPQEKIFCGRRTLQSRRSHPARSPRRRRENLDMPFAALPQQIDDVFKKFDMAALIAADRNSWHLPEWRR